MSNDTEEWKFRLSGGKSGRPAAFVRDDILSPDRLDDSRTKGRRPPQSITGSGSSSGAMPGASSFSHRVADVHAAVGTTSATANADAAQLRIDLQQKDELIAALIHELEQAVEQLDRFQRSGADRSSVSASKPTSSLVSSLVDNDQSRSPLMDDLRRMAEDWEQTQPATLLQRMESQLTSLHDLVMNLQRGDRQSVETSYVEDRVRQLYREPEPTTSADPDSANMTLDETSPTWDAIKNQIFATETPAAAG